MIALAKRGGQVAGAFMWMGYRETLAYPMGFVVGRIGSFAVVISYYFLAQLIPSTPAVGGDYYTFVIIGMVSIQVIGVGLSAFTTTLDYIIQQGQFETYLVEPVNWRLLPFGLGAWPMLINTLIALAMGAFAVLFGATFVLSAIPLAILILALGAASGHAVGILAASIKVIAKRGDPITAIYTLLIGLLAGTAFPVSLLPLPLRVLAYCLPPTYVNSALRKILMPAGDQIPGPSAGVAVLLLIGFLVVLYPLALWLYGRALEYGRKMGLLAGY